MAGEAAYARYNAEHRSKIRAYSTGHTLKYHGFRFNIGGTAEYVCKECGQTLSAVNVFLAAPYDEYNGAEKVYVCDPCLDGSLHCTSCGKGKDAHPRRGTELCGRGKWID